MTDLLDLLHDLDPQPGRPRYDEDTAARTVAGILTGARATPAALTVGDAERVLPAVHAVRPRPDRRRPARRHVAIGAVAAVAVAVVVVAVAVATWVMRPLAAPSPAGRGAVALFGTGIDVDTVTPRVVVTTSAGSLTLWSGSSAALGTCLAVTADSGGWAAAPTVDRGWRPLASGAACLDSRISEQVMGAGLIARFTRDGGSDEVFAGHVTAPERPDAAYTPNNGPTGGVTTAVGVEPAGGATQQAQLADGLFLSPPVTGGSCTTVVARNGAGVTLSSDPVDPACAANPVVREVTPGSTQPDFVENNHLYADDMSSGLSALTVRDPGTGADPDVTLLTLSVQFFDACQTTPVDVGEAPRYTLDPCYRTEIPLPQDLDLQLFYGAGRTAAPQAPGVGGARDDFASPPTPGYVGGKVFGLLVYRTFAVPTDQLGSLTARWPGDSIHAPLLMPNVQRAIR